MGMQNRTGARKNRQDKKITARVGVSLTGQGDGGEEEVLVLCILLISLQVYYIISANRFSSA